jgi:MoxR-like ATPase
VYAYDFWDDRAVLAVNVALAADRPLLVRGPAGCGKSSLARAVAEYMGWNLIDVTITTRTEPQDLLWEMDAVARLADAQQRTEHRTEDELTIERYLRPGPLWWAFNPASAEAQRSNLAKSSQSRARVDKEHHARRSVLLLDEIDKADPDLPNGLLEALGEHRFHVGPLGDEVVCGAEPPLVIITTNEYRELSRPFLRRCIELRLSLPNVAQLVEIAEYHFGRDEKGIYVPLAERCVELRKANTGDNLADERPGTAEYLDAVRACRALNIGPGHESWDGLISMSMQKSEMD